LLFCRVIEKREEHQRNVQIYTIPETVPTIRNDFALLFLDTSQSNCLFYPSTTLLSIFTQKPLSIYLRSQQKDKNNLIFF